MRSNTELLDFSWVSVYETNARAKEVLEYFVSHKWDFQVDNVIRLQKQLADTDKEVFNFDITQVDWPSYMNQYYLGLREFVNRDTDASLVPARKKIKRSVQSIACLLIRGQLNSKV